TSEPFRIVSGQIDEYADAPHPPALLRPRRNRPRRRRAAEEGDELAATDHSITSSAIAITPGGIVRPSALAVLWLITSSNLVECTTGRSTIFAPLRIRPT